MGEETKKCTGCGELLPLTDFRKKKPKVELSTALYSRCKRCDYQRTRKWQFENKERITELRREAYLRMTNDPVRLAKSKRNGAEWFQTVQGRFRTYQDGASKRNIPFLITTEDFLTFWQRPCHYCGDVIKTIGLDRLDAKAGYCLSNIVSCCATCNVSKNGMSNTPFITRMTAIYDNIFVGKTEPSADLIAHENSLKHGSSKIPWRQTLNGRLSRYKESSRARGSEFNMTCDEFASFWQIPCRYCLCEIQTVSLDRIDSDVEYRIDNVVSCCKTCNFLKHVMSIDDFLSKVLKIHNKLITQ